MPTYQYACTDAECANRFELVQSFTDPAATACPICASAVRKVYGSVGVVFKGSGFYRNDSRKAESEATAAKSESKNGDSKSDATKSSDSKSDGKSDAKKSDGGSSPAKSAPGSKSSSGSGANAPASGKAAAPA